MHHVTHTLSKIPGYSREAFPHKWIAIGLIVAGIAVFLFGTLGVLTSYQLLPNTFSFFYIGLYENWLLIAAGSILSVCSAWSLKKHRAQQESPIINSTLKKEKNSQEKDAFFFPPKELLKQHLNSKQSNRKYRETKVFSPLLKREILLWGAAEVDLPRLHISVNREELTEKEIKEIKPKESAELAGPIFDLILKHSGHNETFAISLCILIQQNLMLDLLSQELYVRKGYRKHRGVEGATAGIGAKEIITAIEIAEDFSTFQVTQEQLFSVRPNAEPEKQFFFKAKLLISGKAEDLIQHNTSQLSFVMLYTQNYEEASKALQSDYTRSQAPSTVDITSFLK